MLLELIFVRNGSLQMNLPCFESDLQLLISHLSTVWSIFFILPFLYIFIINIYRKGPHFSEADFSEGGWYQTVIVIVDVSLFTRFSFYFYEVCCFFICCILITIQIITITITTKKPLQWQQQNIVLLCRNFHFSFCFNFNSVNIIICIVINVVINVIE